MQSSLIVFLVWVIRIASAVILFLPLVVTSSTFFPYIFSKIIFFQILVEFAVIPWVALMVMSPAYRPRFRNPITLSLGIFILILGLTSLTGIQPLHSLWSNQERMVGFFTLVHFYVWFLMLTSTHRTWKDWRILFFSSFISSFLVGFVAISQVITLNAERATATFGNPLYLASYALMHTFLGFYVFLRDKGLQFRIFAMTMAVYNIGIIGVTGSRTVTASLILSLLIIGLCCIFMMKWQRSMKIALFGVLLVVAIGSFGFYKFLNTQQGWEWGSAHLPKGIMRVATHAFYFDDRILLWKIAVEGFKEKPLVGWGWENYHIVFNRYFDQYSMFYTLPVQWYDRAHSQVMDVLALSGTVGIVAFAAFWVLLVYCFVRAVRREHSVKGKISLMLLGVIFLSYFLQNITGFDTPVSLFMFYLLLAFVVTSLTEEPVVDPAKDAPDRLPRSFQVIVPSVALLMALGMIYANIIPLSNSVLAMDARRIIAKDPQAGLDIYRRALSHHSFTDFEIRNFVAQDVVFQLLPAGLLESDIKKALYFAREEAEKNVVEFPNDEKSYMAFAGVTRALHRFDQSFTDGAIQRMNKILELAPRRIEAYQELAELYAVKGDYVGAQKVYERITDFLPGRGEPYLLAARSSIQQRNPLETLRLLEQARVHNYPIYSDTRFWYDFVKSLPKNTPQDEVGAKISEARKLYPNVKEYLIIDLMYKDRVGKSVERDALLAEFRKKHPASARDLERYLIDAGITFTPLPPLENKTKKDASS